MSTEKVPSSTAPTAPSLYGTGDSEPQTQIEALVLLAKALAMLNVVTTKANTQELVQNTDINKAFTTAQEKTMKENMRKLQDYMDKLAKQSEVSKWMHYFGIGYIMDGLAKVSEFFDANLSSNPIAKGIEKLAIIAVLTVVSALLFGGMGGILVGMAALTILNPTKDLAEAAAGPDHKEIADWVAMGVNLAIGLIAGGVGLFTGVGEIQGALMIERLLTMVKSTAPRIAEVGEKAYKGLQTTAEVASVVGTSGQAAGQTAQSVFQFQAANVLKEQAPITAALQELVMAIRANASNADRINASSKEFREAIADQLVKFVQLVQPMGEIAKQLEK